MMETGQDEDSKASTEEANRPDHVNDDAGTGRSYECIFCKRGFSTAQALGGHMNIHRRDRARIRQQALPSLPTKPDEDSEILRAFHPFSSHPSFISPISDTLKSYHMNFPSSASSTRYTQPPFHADNWNDRKPQSLSLFGAESGADSSGQAGHINIDGSGEEKVQDGKEGELDLELRLGYIP